MTIHILNYEQIVRNKFKLFQKNKFDRKLNEVCLMHTKPTSGHQVHVSSVPIEWKIKLKIYSSIRTLSKKKKQTKTVSITTKMKFG